MRLHPNRLLLILGLFILRGLRLAAQHAEEDTPSAWDESRHKLSVPASLLSLEDRDSSRGNTSLAPSPSSPPEQNLRSVSRDKLESVSRVAYASYTLIQTLTLSAPFPASSPSSIQQMYSSVIVSLLNLTSPEFNCTSFWLALNLTETCEVSILTGFIPSVSQITQLLSSPSFQATLDQALLSSNVSASLSSPTVTSIFGPAGKFGP